MDASCEIQGSIHVCLILRYVCPGNWVHIIANRFFTWWAIRVRENQFAKKMIEQAGTK